MGDAEAKDGGYSGQIKEMPRPGIGDTEARYGGRRGQVWLILGLGVGGMLRPGLEDAEVRVQQILRLGKGMLRAGLGDAEARYGGC